jgi:hypothetical protein
LITIYQCIVATPAAALFTALNFAEAAPNGNHLPLATLVD